MINLLLEYTRGWRRGNPSLQKGPVRLMTSFRIKFLVSLDLGIVSRKGEDGWINVYRGNILRKMDFGKKGLSVLIVDVSGRSNSVRCDLKHENKHLWGRPSHSRCLPNQGNHDTSKEKEGRRDQESRLITDSDFSLLSQVLFPL